MLGDGADNRKQLAAAWSPYLEVALRERLDDGTPVLEVVFAVRPDLRERLLAALR